MWWLTLGACWFSSPSPPACTDPHLWYAPDNSGDVYFGCDKPEGWLENPPDEGAYAVVMSSPAEETGDPYTDGYYEDPTSTDTPSTDETPSDPRPDTAEELPPDTFDTGDPLPEEEEEPIDTWDTADPEGEGPETADTGLPFEEEPDTADTGLPFEEETGLPPVEDTGLPIGDTGI